MPLGKNFKRAQELLERCRCGEPLSVDIELFRIELAEQRSLTAAERHVMAHATAWDSPNPEFRNHFVTGEGSDDWATIMTLCRRGLMRITRKASELSGGDPVFGVTSAGMRALEATTAPTVERAPEPSLIDQVREVVAETSEIASPHRESDAMLFLSDQAVGFQRIRDLLSTPSAQKPGGGE